MSPSTPRPTMSFVSRCTVPHREVLTSPDSRFELHPYDDACTHELIEATKESREHVAPWMAWLTPSYGWTEARTWVIEAMRTWDGGAACEFLIRDREDGRLAGCCGLNAINRKDMVCNLGYWVRASKLRLGAATSATLLLRDFGFRVLKLNRIEIVVATTNPASQRVAEKVGAVFEGIQRQRIRVGDQVHDARMYALLRTL